MSNVSGSVVLDCVSGYKERMVEGLAALIRIPTENPPGNCYRECQDELVRQIRDLGLEPELIGSDDCACIQSSFGSGGTAVYFHGHSDVVPAFEPQQFAPSVRSAHIFGRGSADMKGGLISMLYAVRAIKDLGVTLNGRVILMF